MKADFTPPEGLSADSLELWADVVPTRCRSAGRLALLTEALRARDRAEQARLALADDSLTTKTATTGAIHLHPLIKAERESRQQFARIWEILGLSFDVQIDGRCHEV